MTEQIGDPDDHDLAVIFEPSRLGCFGWVVAEAIVGVGGTLLFKNFLPEGDTLSKHVLELLAIWATPIAVYAMGIVGFVTHLDTDHYDHTTDHTHLEAAIPKAIVGFTKRSLTRSRKCGTMTQYGFGAQER